MPVYDAAIDAKLEIVHTRHEGAAVHMADARGRLTGEPGVAIVTGGPGHANAVSALYTALACDSPMVLLSGHAPLGQLGKGAFQEMRQADMAAPVAKASWTAQSAAGLGHDMARAFAIARSGLPGEKMRESQIVNLPVLQYDANCLSARQFVQLAREVCNLPLPKPRR